MKRIWQYTLALLLIGMVISCAKDKDNSPTVNKSFKNLSVINSNEVYFAHLFFINEDIGYAIRNAASSSLKKTTDGGKSWTESRAFDSGLSMDFFNKDKGAFVGFWTTKNSPPFEYAQGPLSTDDAGQTWKELLINTDDFVYWDCARPKEDEVFISNEFGILRTKNGGITWDTLLSIFDQSRLHLSFISKDIGYAIALNNFYKTTDGGNNWTFLFNPQIPSNSSDEFLLDAQFISESNGFIVTNDSLYVTTDAGQNWSAPIFVGSQTGNNNVYRGHYGSENILFFIGDQGIYKSSDGGLNYKLINELIDNNRQFLPNSLFMLDEKRGFISASHTYITGHYANTNSVFLKTTTGWE